MDPWSPLLYKMRVGEGIDREVEGGLKAGPLRPAQASVAALLPAQASILAPVPAPGAAGEGLSACLGGSWHPLSHCSPMKVRCRARKWWLQFYTHRHSSNLAPSSLSSFSCSKTSNARCTKGHGEDTDKNRWESAPNLTEAAGRGCWESWL